MGPKSVWSIVVGGGVMGVVWDGETVIALRLL